MCSTYVMPEQLVEAVLAVAQVELFTDQAITVLFGQAAHRYGGEWTCFAFESEHLDNGVLEDALFELRHKVTRTNSTFLTSAKLLNQDREVLMAEFQSELKDQVRSVAECLRQHPIH